MNPVAQGHLDTTIPSLTIQLSLISLMVFRKQKFNTAIMESNSQTIPNQLTYA